MRRASLEARLAWLGILTALVDLGSAYVKVALVPRGVTAGDAIQLLGTYPLLALYAWIALDLRSRNATAGAGLAPVLFLAAVTYALGSGVHVAANSIHDMLDRTGLRDPWHLVYFWDEHLGHYLVDAARATFVVALTAWELLVPAVGGPGEGRAVTPPGSRRILLVAGALAYGFIYFATSVEGQTVPLALPFSTVYAVWAIARRGRGEATVRTFFGIAAIASLILFVVWGLRNGGFPEFSRTGLL